MSTIDVWYLDGDRFAITARDHTLTIDQPLRDGGTDSAPTPTEMFVASVAGCVAFYARRYLARHALPSVGLRVRATYRIATQPTRVSDIRLAIDLPDGVPAERRAALLAVASHCTVGNSLADPPEVTVALADDVAVA